jgi:hypothetical protein
METLKQILLEINALLKKHHSVEWSKSFDSFLTKLDQQNIEVVKKTFGAYTPAWAPSTT